MVNSNNDSMTRLLPLSHMVYRDSEIDTDKANQFAVYHYPLIKRYTWQEWRSRLDKELSDRYHPYLMRSYRGQFGLFVALDSLEDKPPIIQNGDDYQLFPERVNYTPEMNPIWIRLIMRKVAAFGSHCKGSYTLGRPLLKLDVWRGKKSTGINAISLDCRTQQLSDHDTTEVVLFYANVPLRLVTPHNCHVDHPGSLWVYDKNNVLVRYFPAHGQAPKSLYKEIKKNKNRRKQRPFLDLSSAKAFKTSWPYILKPVQDQLIQDARDLGFKLKPKVLNLKPLPLRTKYKSNPSTRSLIPSMNLSVQVDVLDLRFTKVISSAEIVERIQKALDEKQLGTRLSLLPNIAVEEIGSLNFNRNQRVLVLLDQLAGVLDDRYPLTRHLRSKVACQHINVNPYDLIYDSVEQKFLIEDRHTDGKTYLIPNVDSPYYDYESTLFDEKQCYEALKRNAEIVIKELELKHLVISQDAKVSTSLPEQKDLLTKKLVVITDGCLFTVKNDRPLFIPFHPANPKHVQLCDEVLSTFGTSVASLITLLQDNWPYSYQPEAVMQGFGSPAEKLNRFARRLTFVIHQSETVSIFLQDPQYDRPHILPPNLDEALESLRSQHLKRSLASWQLPGIEILRSHLNQLLEDHEITLVMHNKLDKSLESLVQFWNTSLKELARNNSYQIDYQNIRKDTLKCFLAEQNSNRTHGERPKVRNDSYLVSAWTKLLSRIFELPLDDVRGWLRNIPGLLRLWHDPDNGYYVVGSLAPLKKKLLRQPSIRQWHALQGELDTQLLTALIDVDWVRTNQLAGNPCVAVLIKRWRECHLDSEKASNS